MFPDKSLTQLPPPSAGVITQRPLLFQSRKVLDSHPVSKETVVSSGATNANKLQLLLLYFSPYLSSKYVHLGGKNELFKIHLIHSEVLKKKPTISLSF